MALAPGMDRGRRHAFARSVALLAACVVWLASCTSAAWDVEPRSSPTATIPRADAPWLRDVVVVSVWPLDPDQTSRFGIEVPGVFTWWNAPKVRAIQRQGRIAVVNVEGLAAEPYLLREHPELRGAVSRDVFGEEARAGWYQTLQGAPDPVVVLSILSPVFQDYLLAQGRRAVDIGADAFYIDEIQSSALLIGRDRYAAGFGELELEAYGRELRALGFDSPAAWLASRSDADWLTDELAGSLAAPELARRSVPELLRSTDPSLSAAQTALFEDYRRFQEDQAIRVMRDLIDRVRAYAAERDRSLAIGANLAGMGDRTWWSPLMSVGWAPLLDFVVFENDVEVPGSTTYAFSFPQGSFAPTYRLGRAVTPGLVAAFPSVAFAPALHDLDRNATFLAVMYAEAFAFEGNWALGWWNEEMGWPREELAPASLVPLTRFVTRWHRLYEGPRTPNDVAVFYSNQAVLAESQRHRSYVGLAQALGTLGVQYDVVYGGDERFGEVPLDPGSLDPYRIVFVPTANTLTAGQVRALRAYADAGGRVVALAPVDPALSETGVQVIDDVGLSFRSGDAAGALDLLDVIVGAEGRVRLGDPGQGVLATTYLREDLPAFVVHLVNERYRPFADTVEAAEDLEVRVDRPAGFDEGWRLWVLAPGEEPVAVPYRVDEDAIAFTVTRLDVYAVAVFAEELPGA